MCTGFNFFLIGIIITYIRYFHPNDQEEILHATRYLHLKVFTLSGRNMGRPDLCQKKHTSPVNPSSVRWLILATTANVFAIIFETFNQVLSHFMTLSQILSTLGGSSSYYFLREGYKPTFQQKL